MLGPWIREGPYRAFYVLYRALGLGTGVFERKRDIARAWPEKRGPFIAEIAAGVTYATFVWHTVSIVMISGIRPSRPILWPQAKTIAA